MFKQRFFTAIILIPLVLGAIYYAYSWMLIGVLLFILLMGGLEWTQLIPLHNPFAKTLYILLLIPLTWGCFLLFAYWLPVGLIGWSLILLAVLSYPGSKKWWGFPIIVGGSSYLLMPLFAASMAAIYQYEKGQDLMVYLLFLVWAADIGGYLVGKQWGRHKLIPKVSPGKTIEGLTGGLVLALAVAAFGCYYFKPQSIVFWVLLGGSVAIISILGDLFISMLKRRCDLKDTGHIFPGHGGVLDRLDSLMAASPFFYMGLTLMAPSMVT